MAEIVVGISTANRFTDFAAVLVSFGAHGICGLFRGPVAKVRPRARPNEFLVHWSRSVCLSSPSLAPPLERR